MNSSALHSISDHLSIAVQPVTAFQQNSSLIVCRDTGAAAIVDPGGDAELLEQLVERAEVQLEKVLLTHGHLDHAAAASQVAKHFGVQIEGPHKADLFWLQQLQTQARTFGLPAGGEVVPDRWLEHGDRVTVGALELEVLHCPGHTPGHVVFFQRAARFCWVGDVLFQGSIGRTDFPQSDHAALISAIHGRLLPLGDDVTFLPGHGPTSTLGEERRSNPFLVSR
ncbi:MAG: hydroxyacylglutathione hydrolase [Planctomycetota bacterium]|jgi:hydroxyacylglutathione hydrolase